MGKFTDNELRNCGYGMAQCALKVMPADTLLVNKFVDDYVYSSKIFKQCERENPDNIDRFAEGVAEAVKEKQLGPSLIYDKHFRAQSEARQAQIMEERHNKKFVIAFHRRHGKTTAMDRYKKK